MGVLRSYLFILGWDSWDSRLNMYWTDSPVTVYPLYILGGFWPFWGRRTLKEKYYAIDLFQTRRRPKLFDGIISDSDGQNCRLGYTPRRFFIFYFDADQRWFKIFSICAICFCDLWKMKRLMGLTNWNPLGQKCSNFENSFGDLKTFIGLRLGVRRIAVWLRREVLEGRCLKFIIIT